MFSENGEGMRSIEPNGMVASSRNGINVPQWNCDVPLAYILNAAITHYGFTPAKERLQKLAGRLTFTIDARGNGECRKPWD